MDTLRVFAAHRWAPHGIAALLLVAVPASADAQQPTDADALAVLAGRVVDEITGTPLHGAYIELAGTRQAVLSDQEGNFTLRVRPGTYTVRVSQLGYEEGEVQLRLAAGTVQRDFAVTPSPLVLEGIQVVEDRFRFRRNALGTSVRVFDRSAMLSAAGSDMRVLLSRLHINLVPCDGVGWHASVCGRVRGRVQPIRVAIDEFPAWGVDQLLTYQPHELFMLEVYGGGSHIRAYTVWYMEWAAKRRPLPVPVLF
jgi:hypothetical protein